ncbi:hypothetical protein KM043_018252 [Ampulex compressa]|nr:hypothetical protein KM043_018252 [Ampulex compressa]
MTCQITKQRNYKIVSHAVGQVALGLIEQINREDRERFINAKTIDTQIQSPYVEKKYVEDLIAKFDVRQAKAASTPIAPNLKVTKEAAPLTEEERQEMKS